MTQSETEGVEEKEEEKLWVFERLGHVKSENSYYNSLRSGKSEGESLPQTYRIIHGSFSLLP